MRRRALTACAALACLAAAAAPAARAEFILRQVSPLLMPADVPAEVPRAPLRPKPGLPRAQGFGEAVPLRFAAAQIVPRDVHLEWGAGVDPDAEVTWRGGRPWDAVLAEAVRPLGYKLRVNGWRASLTR